MLKPFSSSSHVPRPLTTLLRTSAPAPRPPFRLSCPPWPHNSPPMSPSSPAWAPNSSQAPRAPHTPSPPLERGVSQSPPGPPPSPDTNGYQSSQHLFRGGAPGLTAGGELGYEPPTDARTWTPSKTRVLGGPTGKPGAVRGRRRPGRELTFPRPHVLTSGPGAPAFLTPGDQTAPSHILVGPHGPWRPAPS